MFSSKNTQVYLPKGTRWGFRRIEWLVEREWDLNVKIYQVKRPISWKVRREIETTSPAKMHYLVWIYVIANVYVAYDIVLLHKEYVF